MIVTEPTYETVFYIARNLRQSDRDEIFGLRFHDSPFILTSEVMARPELSWVIWHEGFPAAIIGAVQVTPGVWSLHCFGTDNFDKVAKQLTRFAMRRLKPMIFGELGGHRAQTDALVTNTASRKWIEFLGGVQESVMKGRGRRGEDYVTYALTKPPMPPEDTAALDLEMTKLDHGLRDATFC